MIELHTLTDGGQEPLEVAQRLAGFLSAAQETLDIAIYDIRLTGEVADVVRGAFEDASARGVNIRLAYNVDPTTASRCRRRRARDPSSSSHCRSPRAAIRACPT